MSLMQLGRLLLALVSLACVSLADVPTDLPQLCYTGKNNLAPSSLLPCFNGAIDDGAVYGCCLAGDLCLENQACYNKYRDITYQKGCTSSEYGDSKCPRKCDTDQSKADWVGLIYCNGTNGTPSNTWICQHPDNCFKPANNCPLSGSAKWDPGLEITRTTYCENINHTQRWVAFEDDMNLRSTASLPQPSYVSAWWDAHANYSTRWDPSARPIDSPSNATSSVPGSNGPISTSKPTTASPQGTSSPNGNKLGMAIGLGLGIPLILSTIGFLVYLLRKRRNRGGAGTQPQSDIHSGDAARSENAKSSTGNTHDYPTKAELPADEKAAQVPELEGSSVVDYKSPMASPLMSKGSGKVDVQDHGVGKASVYELQG